MKLEEEAKQPTETACRREKEAQSGQMKADGSEMDRDPEPYGDRFQ